MDMASALSLEQLFDVRLGSRGCAVLPQATGDAAGGKRRFYLALRAKFAIACSIAVFWTGLSIWLSLPWARDLGAATDSVFALIAITFIAYIPGFMNAFLLSTLLLDRQPPRRAPAKYPGATIL